ncbi:protein serine/threonine phosphatase 2C [Rickenella mellea]|uniref:Protein serine/threonine phosphatase 2C n=1 Tax=Rickenella mellea TaxID=50990 RepID=A0A4Y7QM30_9AGAM|nr:protein serine/threonine phosphatase 2C [Rickenella mellea]
MFNSAVFNSAFRFVSKRAFHTYIKAATPGGSIRIPLGSPKVIGIATSRGNRSYQEDSFQFAALSLDPEELRLSAKKSFGVDWDPNAAGEAYARQVLFVGIFDGHGGQAVSLYLHQHLHDIFESVDKSHIPELFEWIKELGGYFKRFRGGALNPWLHNPPSSQPMDLEARATMAFFQADRILSEGHEAKSCGATASVALLHSLDVPKKPFFSADQIGLTVAHAGDTRILLCATEGGRVYPMTQDHHAETRVEAARLRRMGGTSLITDSFGEARWMGALANTRGLGDLKFKQFGVTAEPEIRSKLLRGADWAYMIFVTDGISSVLSDAEISDLARDSPDPKTAGDKILAFAEEMGSEDNATVIVLPLPGWGKIRGPDRTKELREYRRQQMVGSERQRRM